MAFVAVPLLSIVFAIVGGGMLLWAKAAAQIAAAQTARCVAIGSTECVDPAAYARALLTKWGRSSLLPEAEVVVEAGSTCGSNVGHYADVTVTAPAGALGDMVAGLSGTSLVARACYPSGS
ncbi:MAG: hypothetical protein H7Z10_04235 [Gemmatimonadaceae bacterium]|nr:hypothetical protein [Acetobacteraceae bacterium]